VINWLESLAIRKGSVSTKEVVYVHRHTDLADLIFHVCWNNLPQSFYRLLPEQYWQRHVFLCF